MGIKINKVYTRSGDDGFTGLVGGRRVRKTDERVKAFGDIDELNATLGLTKEFLPIALNELRPLIENLQQELFDLGSELATAPEDFYDQMWHVTASHVIQLEKLCDLYGEGLPELTSFILPGGSVAASYFHVARTVARRAERSVIELQKRDSSSKFNGEIIKYLNRLNDLLFILARHSLLKEGRSAPLWVKEKDR